MRAARPFSPPPQPRNLLRAFNTQLIVAFIVRARPPPPCSLPPRYFGLRPSTSSSCATSPPSLNSPLPSPGCLNIMLSSSPLANRLTCATRVRAPSPQHLVDCCLRCLYGMRRPKSPSPPSSKVRCLDPKMAFRKYRNSRTPSLDAHSAPRHERMPQDGPLWPQWAAVAHIGGSMLM